MPKSNSSIPPSILSFVKKSKSLDDDYGNGEDRAFLIPSHGSSFNLAEDTEYLRPSISDLRGPSTSRNSNPGGHHAVHPSTSHFSTSSSKSSRAASHASSSSGGKSGPRHHHHYSNRSNLSGGSNRSGRKGSGNGKHRRKLSSPRLQKQSELDSSHSAHSRSSGGSHSSGARSHGGERSYSQDRKQIERRNTLPMADDSDAGYNNNIQKKPSLTSALQESDDGYLLGYDIDNIPRGLTASTSFQSGVVNMPRNPSQNTINTIHSGRSYKSQKSTTTSNRSGKSVARRKLKRQEQRREWVRRWRRRQFVGTVILTTIYSLLCAYTLVVTLGPLFLQIYDPDLIEWCPYYWDDEYYAEHDKGQHTSNSGYSLNIDQLQQSRKGDQQRRRLATQQRDEPLTVSDLKKIEINMLKRTSKDVHNSDNDEDSDEEKSKYENPDYNDDPCHLMRIPFLFYLTLEECDLSRRMATSVMLGGFIGYERRASDRPAGIRTMALVALGSCFFTISSQLAFRDSPMTWDSSRVTAAIPSGVGFLGAGLIWKGSLSDGSGGEVHQVHGITTAASVWLAACVGCGAGGALYAVSFYSTALVILVLRFGPRLYLQHDKGFEYDDDEEDEDDDYEDIEDDEHRNGDENRKYNAVPEETAIPTTKITDKTTVTQRHNYEMHHMGDSTNDTTALIKDETKYGAMDIEEQNATTTVAQLLQQNQKRQMERMQRLEQSGHQPSPPPEDVPPLLSWLANLLPGGNKRRQPPNPYQELSRDREVMKMMKKKKSMKKMKSSPSFCT